MKDLPILLIVGLLAMASAVALAALVRSVWREMQGGLGDKREDDQAARRDKETVREIEPWREGK